MIFHQLTPNDSWLWDEARTDLGWELQTENWAHQLMDDALLLLIATQNQSLFMQPSPAA